MTSPMVHGPRKAALKAGLWTRVAWLSLRAYRNPIRAVRAVRRMLAARSRVQAWTTTKYAHAGGRVFWNFYSPGWPSPAFDKYVERELDRVDPFRGAPPALQTVIFGITKTCPLRCEHCFEWDALNQAETLSVESLRAIVARLHERGVAQVLLSGGEPLRRFDDLLPLVESASGESDVWLLTSGLGLTAERARALRNAGLTGVALSLDHWNPEEHDRFRGTRGSFAWVERGAASAREHGLLVTLSLVPTRAFVSDDNLERYGELARRLGAGFVQLIEPRAVGHYAGKDVALTPAQQGALERFFERMNRARDRRDHPAVAYQDFARRSVGCHGAGDRHLYVDTDGAVHPCPFCRHPAGRVLDGNFDETLEALQAVGCGAPGNGAAHG